MRGLPFGSSWMLWWSAWMPTVSRSGRRVPSSFTWSQPADENGPSNRPQMTVPSSSTVVSVGVASVSSFHQTGTPQLSTITLYGAPSGGFSRSVGANAIHCDTGVPYRWTRQTGRLDGAQRTLCDVPLTVKLNAWPTSRPTSLLEEPSGAGWPSTVTVLPAGTDASTVTGLPR